MITGQGLHLTEAEQRRIEQIDRLLVLGSFGVDELLASMSDPSWTVRRASVAALAALGDDAVGPLCAWLRTRRTEEHSIAAAVDALTASIGGSATEAVIALLANTRPAVAADAAQILGRRRANDATPMLRLAIAHDDDNVAVAAIEALGAIGGGSATEELIGVLRGKVGFRTFPALQVLAKLDDPRAVAPLATLLANEVYRSEAVRALGRTGSSQAIAPLAALLAESGDPSVPMIALALAELLARAAWHGVINQVAAMMRTRMSPCLARFIRAVPVSTAEERGALAVVLGWIGDASALPALAGLLDDVGVHEVTTEAIQRIGRAHDEAQLAALAMDSGMQVAMLPVVNSRRAATSVIALLANATSEVRARACESLARIGDSTALPELFEMLGDSNPRVALAATGAIHSLGGAGTGARAIAALEHGSPTVRRNALRIIGYLGFPEAFDAICIAVGDPDPRLAELAIASLGAIDDRRVDRVLGEIAHSPFSNLRAAAMRAAVHRLGGGAAEMLEGGVADESPWVRYYACQGLGRIGRFEAVGLLVARLGDVAPHVRISAIEALAHLDTPVAWRALVSAAHSADLDERRAALVSIGLRAQDAALPLLLGAATSSDVVTRLIALSGLARRSEDTALEVIGAAALDRTIEVCEAALSLLGERPDPAAAETLVDLALACEPDHPVHLTLSRPGAARIAAIAARLTIVDDRRATILATALARMRNDAATTTLFEALTITNPPARRAAATMLVAMGVDGGRSAVARLATEDPDLDVRGVCASLVAG